MRAGYHRCFLCHSLENKIKLWFSFSKGNFWNVCGIIAKKNGLPVVILLPPPMNDTVPRFLKTEFMIPQPSKATISNAMDGKLSNFVHSGNVSERFE
jgi:threonine synthase